MLVVARRCSSLMVVACWCFSLFACACEKPHRQGDASPSRRPTSLGPTTAPSSSHSASLCLSSSEGDAPLDGAKVGSLSLATGKGIGLHRQVGSAPAMPQSVESNSDLIVESARAMRVQQGFCAAHGRPHVGPTRDPTVASVGSLEPTVAPVGSAEAPTLRRLPRCRH